MISRFAIITQGLHSLFVWCLIYQLTTGVVIWAAAEYWAAVYLSFLHPLYWFYWGVWFALLYFPARSDSIRFKTIALAVQAAFTFVVFYWMMEIMENAT